MTDVIKKTGKRDGVFFNQKTAPDGKVFFTPKSGVFPDYVTAKQAGDDLILTIGAESKVLELKTNDYGKFYVGEVCGKTYAMSIRDNDKGHYILARPLAPKVTDSAGRTARPEAYGTRQG
jgi:hypothetical protein